MQKRLSGRHSRRVYFWQTKSFRLARSVGARTSKLSSSQAPRVSVHPSLGCFEWAPSTCFLANNDNKTRRLQYLGRVIGMHENVTVTVSFFTYALACFVLLFLFSFLVLETACL